MPSMAAALTALGAMGLASALSQAIIPPYGVRNSYDPISPPGSATALPDKLSRAQLPCLLIYPEVGLDQGMELLTFMGGVPRLRFAVTQLYIGVESSPLGVANALPGQIAFLDAYNAYVKANPLLPIDTSPIYQAVLKYTVDIGLTEYAEVQYHSIAFKHIFELYL